jgi:hypothetical protein
VAPGFWSRFLVAVLLVSLVAGAAYLVVRSTPDPSSAGLSPTAYAYERGTPTGGQTPTRVSCGAVTLNPITKRDSYVQIASNGLPLTKETPYGYSLLLQNFTVLGSEDTQDGKTTWVTLATGGDRLTKADLGVSTPNFDGSRTEEFMYRGAGAIRVGLNDGVLYGTNNMGQGRTSALRDMIKKGNAVTIQVDFAIPFDLPKQEMNLRGLEQLNQMVGDLSDCDVANPAITFFIYHVYPPLDA